MKRPPTSPSEEESPSKRLHAEKEIQSSEEKEDSESDHEELTSDQPSEGLGSIKSVELINFMCHSYLKVDFGSKINFVTGPNGSGKSAILTALTVALGGRANFTNRATSISKLLKSGKDAGEIIVKLRNHGHDSFKNDEFGDVIVIERKITRDGPAPYKIKSEKGKLISTRKEDITAICDHFQIEVDNPMAILTQDTARMFLSNSSAKEKYKFFLKGTQLDRLLDDYKKLEQSTEYIRVSMERKTEVLPDLEAEVSVLEKKFQQMKQARNLETLVNNLQSELIWSKVADLEKKRDDEVKKLKNIAYKLQQVDVKLGNEEEEKNGFDATLRKLEKRLKVSEDGLNPLKEKFDDEKRNVRVAEQKKEDLTRQREELTADLKQCEKDIAETKARIIAENQKLNNATNNANTRAEELERLENLKSATENLCIEKTRLMEDVDQQLNAQARSRSVFEEKVQNVRSQVENIKKNIYSVQMREKDQVSAFGHNMNKILREIAEYERAGKWSGRKPIGPLGLHVKVIDMKYRKVIESLLDKILNGFAVETNQDYRLLQQILRNNNCTSPVFKSSSRANFDFSSGRPDKSLRTILDIIDNDVVLQQLVINNRIEKTVLVDSHQEGDKLTEGRWPNNVIAVYTADCFSIGNKAGGLNTSALKVYEGAPRLATDTKSMLRELENDLKIKEEKLSFHQKELSDFVGQCNAKKRKIEELQREQFNLKSEIRRLDQQIRSMRTEMEMDDTTNVAEFTNYLSELKEKRLTFNAQFDVIEDGLKHAIVELQEFNSRLKEIEGTMSEDKREVSRVRAEIDQHMKRASTIASNIQHYQDRKQSYEIEHTQLEAAIAETNEVLRLKTEECLEYSDRVEVTRRTAEIEQELRSATAQLKEKEQEFDPRLLVEIERKQKLLEDAKRECAEFEELLVVVTRTRQIRRHRFEKFKKYISVRAKRLFSQLVAKRGYRGVLMLLHDKQELELEVDVENTAEEQSLAERDAKENLNRKDARALSGGEKSYSTVCLLLALWEAMTSPFRALDEFDVFMDAVNRRLAMKLIVEHARTSVHQCQYLLISPQNTTVKDFAGNDIKVLRMNPPERGQMRLNFQPAERP